MQPVYLYRPGVFVWKSLQKTQFNEQMNKRNEQHCFVLLARHEITIDNDMRIKAFRNVCPLPFKGLGCKCVRWSDVQGTTQTALSLLLSFPLHTGELRLPGILSPFSLWCPHFVPKQADNRVVSDNTSNPPYQGPRSGIYITGHHTRAWHITGITGI